MKPNFRHAWICFALWCLHGLATAEVPAATAEALMRKSGIWAQLADVVTQVKVGMDRATQDGSLPPDEIQRLLRIADDAFSASRLRDSVLQTLSLGVTQAQSADALRWFGSPAGRQITAMEEAFSANFDDMNQVLADGHQALAQASPKRHSLLSQMVKASHAAEAMATVEINVTLGILQGLASATPHAGRAATADLRKVLEAKRPQMVASNVGVALTIAALTYQTASDKTLEQYVHFLSSTSGTALTNSMLEAVDQSLTHAAKRFGGAIPKAPGATTL